MDSIPTHILILLSYAIKVNRHMNNFTRRSRKCLFCVGTENLVGHSRFFFVYESRQRSLTGCPHVHISMSFGI